MNRILFLFFLLITLSRSAQAQEGWKLAGKSLFQLKQEQQTLLPLPTNLHFGYAPFDRYTFTPWPALLSVKKNANNAGRASGPYLPRPYQYDHLAFFCRVEVKLEKAASFPVKFRLGDVAYVDWLEGKSQEMKK